MNNILISDIEYRPCYVRGKKALFHKYIKILESTIALVEYEDGQVDEVDPILIKFCDQKMKGISFLSCRKKEGNKDE